MGAVIFRQSGGQMMRNVKGNIRIYQPSNMSKNPKYVKMFQNIKD